MKDYYKILELNFGANELEVKKAYRTLVQKYHPDKNFGQRTYEEKLKEVNEAYTFLSDSTKKTNYDIQYKNIFNKQSSSSTNNTNSTNNNRNNENRNSNANSKTENDNNTTNMNDNTKTIKKNIFSNKPIVFLFIALIISIGILIYKWNDITYYYEEKERMDKYSLLVESVGKTKKYEELSIPTLLLKKINLETRWKDHLMYYKFKIYSEDSDSDNSKRNSNVIRIETINNDAYFETRVKSINEVNINFLDKDGFEVYNLKISIGDMTRILNKKGKAVGYSINSNIDLSAELYNEFQGWDISYNTN